MLEQASGWLAPVAILIAGLVIRALLFAGILIIVGVPIVAALFGWQGVVWLADRAAGIRQVGHLRWREGCYYAPAHLWLRQRGENQVRVGIDDVAQRVLPGILTVGLPPLGTVVARGDPIGNLCFADEVVTLRSPVGGTIRAVNERVVQQPDLLHRDPYRRAWLVEVRPSELSYLQLPIADRARAWLADEGRRLTELMEGQCGIAAADGGELAVAPKHVLTPAQWRQIRSSLLDRAT
jgi:glycine cleavage system H protein